MTTETPPKRPNLWTALDPYAQLITTLLPRAAGVAAYDAACEQRVSERYRVAGRDP
jgi:hypothetical protein